MDETLKEYQLETQEQMERIASCLQKLEKDAKDSQYIQAIYRDIHTFKGIVMLLGLRNLGTLAHTLESVLEPVRSRGEMLTPVVVDVLLASVDLIQKINLQVLDTGHDSGFEAEIRHLSLSLIENQADAVSGVLPLVMDRCWPEENPFPSPLKWGQSLGKNSISTSQDNPNDSAVQEESEKKPPPMEHAHMTVETHNEKENSGDGLGTLRISVGLLDNLMNLVGELVLIRNQLTQQMTQFENTESFQPIQRLNTLTVDLQAEVMKTRLQPIGNVTHRCQRITRDLCRELGKKVELQIRGDDTELDKTLIEAIRDPLIHLVRNCVDHGIEAPEERLRLGKDETGRLIVSSAQEGGQVIIQIQDDGRGLQRKKIEQRAIEKGLISPEKASRLSDAEISQFIFHHGFSTAEKLTQVSGRGIGMDVVKTNIERVGGRVEIQSTEGVGSTFTLRIPLTLAIVPALLVTVCKERFAIPQVKLQELVRIDNEGGRGWQVENLHGFPVYRLRGHLLPLLSLKHLLGLGGTQSESVSMEEIEALPTLHILVLNADGVQMGLLVDEVLDNADIVVKPLPPFLKSLQIYAGATVLGDGVISLILDVGGLAERAHVKSIASCGRLDDGGHSKGAKETLDFLLFTLETNGRFAIPLCMVHRLEEFSPVKIEISGGLYVVQYRDDLLPLIDIATHLELGKRGLGDRLQQEAHNPDFKLPVIVVKKRNRYFGLVVNEIEDIVYYDKSIDDKVKDRKGVLGNIIAQSYVTLVVDTYAIVDSLLEKLGMSSQDNDFFQKNSADPKHILLADDTPFFQKHVGKLLLDMGYKVTLASDGAEALQLLDSGLPADVILSDIEMPKLNGFQLAEAVRSRKKLQNIPLIALSSRYSEADLAKGKTSGFDFYLEKFNVDTLFHSVSEALKIRRNTV